MSCKLTANITKENCSYEVGGLREVYLINYDIANEYKLNEKGLVETITLPEGQNAYKVDCIAHSASFTDELAENGNGGKYRTHTVNFSLTNNAYCDMNRDRALSLGAFTAIVVEKSGSKEAPIIKILGRNNGLNATSHNYNSGAVDADAYGWTTVLAGSELEEAKCVKDMAVIKAIIEDAVIVP